MTRHVPIQLHVSTALKWLGSVYRNPADAIKEHISNAIDEHLKAQRDGRAAAVCEVIFELDKRSIAVAYPYGMDRREFEEALQRVANSAKKSSDVRQIGQLGIGMFSFLQIGGKCVFLSKKNAEAETLRVTIKEGADEAEFDGALKREALQSPGIQIVITELKVDPTRRRGPLAPERLQQLFAEKFDDYLRRGQLRITIRSRSGQYDVKPVAIGLPPLAKGVEVLRLPGEPTKTVCLHLYFDSSANGTVAIRHTGVAVVEDFKALPAYGLEDSIYASGYVKGFIDADFLRPLPARSGFEENTEWIAFLDLLDKHRPQIEAEVEQLRQEERDRALSQVQRAAVELAREILDREEFRDLELLGGMARHHAGAEPKPKPEPKPAPMDLPSPDRKPPDHKQSRGRRINYVERSFESGPGKHSRFLGGEVQVNDLNPDFKKEMNGLAEAQLAYAALMIGKETIAYNDKSRVADEYLERLLSFYFRVKDRVSPHAAVAGKRGRGRPPRVI